METTREENSILPEPKEFTDSGQLRRESLEKTLAERTSWTVIVLLFALLVFCNIYDSFDNTRLCQKLTTLKAELKPYQLERTDLQYSLRDLKTEYTRKKVGNGTAVILFTEIGENVYTEAFTQMKDFEITGSLAISAKQLPGKKDCMSREQFDEIIENGWSTVLLLDGNKPIAEQLEKLAETLDEENIPFPKTVCFTSNTYRSHNDSLLYEYGFTAVIHHGEEKLGVLSYNFNSAVCQLGAMGWNTSSARQKLESAIDYGGNVVFAVGSECEYDGESFENMLEKMKAYCDAGNLTVTDASGAVEYHKSIYGTQDEISDEFDEKKTEIEEKIQDVDNQMKEVYAEYGW